MNDYPKPESIWVYHPLECHAGSLELRCPYCGFVSQAFNAPPIPQGVVFIPAFVSGKRILKGAAPKNRFIVRCVPYDSRLEPRRIPDFLGGLILSIAIKAIKP